MHFPLGTTLTSTPKSQRALRWPFDICKLCLEHLWVDCFPPSYPQHKGGSTPHGGTSLWCDAHLHWSCDAHTHLTLPIWLLGPSVGAIVCRRNFILTYGRNIVLVGRETLPVATERWTVCMPCRSSLLVFYRIEWYTIVDAWPCRSSLLVSLTTSSPTPFLFVFCFVRSYYSGSDLYY